MLRPCTRLSVISGTLPVWAVTLPRMCPFLFSRAPRCDQSQKKELERMPSHAKPRPEDSEDAPEVHCIWTILRCALDAGDCVARRLGSLAFTINASMWQESKVGSFLKRRATVQTELNASSPLMRRPCGNAIVELMFPRHRPIQGRCRSYPRSCCSASLQIVLSEAPQVLAACLQSCAVNS